MKRQVITIEDNGTINIPSEVKMTITEIADLFGVYYQTIKRNIRAIEKSDIIGGDYSLYCVVAGMRVYPEYYGLEMVIAIAFRVQSPRTDMFRQWVCLRATLCNTQ